MCGTPAPRARAPFALFRGVSTALDVIVAALGLNEVRSVIGAIHRADQRGAELAAAADFADASRAATTREPLDRFEPRPVVHPEPRYERRPVIHPEPRFETRPGDVRCHLPPPEQIVVVVEKDPAALPLQPPWKTLPWENLPQTSPKIKVARYLPDISHKGMLLDFFI